MDELDEVSIPSAEPTEGDDEFTVATPTPGHLFSMGALDEGVRMVCAAAWSLRFPFAHHPLIELAMSSLIDGGQRHRRRHLNGIDLRGVRFDRLPASAIDPFLSISLSLALQVRKSETFLMVEAIEVISVWSMLFLP